MRKEKFFVQTVQQQGPEGSSLYCAACGSYEYVEPVRNRVWCPKCNRDYSWQPRIVLCASPDHNGPGNCSNNDCWKH